MSKLIATLVASLFAAAAFAQTGGVPPSVPPAGTGTKMEMKKDTTMATDKPAATTDKAKARADRKAKRAKAQAEKVGPKPLN